ncbi:MAG TPA: bifunctional (p)ppGpp synthetase/guanosine-3',5'-bis(diphosphate) 3'-pyrophosphohydrolase [Methylophilus sp.]|uniref:RelA/SpoT family protein n=1 Tax=Methylophilus sp. TaxID=29541 RepID=UPI002C80AAC2|nr:bifunctional (p)ppGpp synthetase/guanosine-3',5'-bis(diphosphate) 3'-pyrophosphohydrolase [Methylophilus sp.]HSH87154.1 bifunctional (p)ppGpp synthetase/guanosine-3',5'-bis(diphosphate) 3'-pyrophosphohydrolase [Methylophilus sp.]
MVSVHHPISALLASNEGDFSTWLEAAAKRFLPSEVELISCAYALAVPLYSGRSALTGTPLLLHALGAATILIDMNMDVETIAATILHAVPEYLADWRATLETRLGTNIADLVEGISRMEQIQALSETESLHGTDRKNEYHAQQIESLRKMLLAMVQDIRVVLIKLAERTQTLRHLSGASPSLQKQIAQESQSLFAPLANRLGVWQLKWELEDLSLRYLEPQIYKEIAHKLDERRVDREQYIIDVVAELQKELLEAGIKGEVAGRPKHIYSIIKKMKSKHLDFTQLYDVRAVRVLVNDIKDCYAVLGLIHNLWQPIPGEFDDYIARPKSNNYRSLHTAVSGPRGLALEVQIRTFEMHQHSELGVAAHWRYKEGGKSDAKFDEKIAWLRQILAWKDDVSESGDLIEQFKSELFQDRVYVLTPLGKVIDLPKGSTPIDFAYTLHTDLGHRTRGAKINGSIVPLNTKLQNGQRVEILTSKLGSPSRDWLNASLGYLQSTSARAKVRQWFKYQHFDENVAQGRVKLDRELHRAGIGTINHEKIAQKLHFQKLEDFLAAIGRGDVSEHQISLAIQEDAAPKPETVTKILAPRRNTALQSQAAIVIEGVGNLQTGFAKCCKPLPPDTIVGYLTRDHGVTIHRSTCGFIGRLPEERRDRVLGAQWGSYENFSATVDIEVEAHDRQGLLRDISDLFAREKINATKANTISRHNLALMQFSIEVTNLEQLSHLLTLIQQVPNVISAQRRY